MREPLKGLRSQVEAFWTPPDTYLVDAGTMAETLIARVRLGLVVVLMLYPTIDAVVEAAMVGATRVTGLASSPTSPPRSARAGSSAWWPSRWLMQRCGPSSGTFAGPSFR